MGKIQMKKIPIVKDWMKAAHCVFIDRNDIKQGLKCILECIDDINNGISIAIFPEEREAKSMVNFFHSMKAVSKSQQRPVVRSSRSRSIIQLPYGKTIGLKLRKLMSSLNMVNLSIQMISLQKRRSISEVMLKIS